MVMEHIEGDTLADRLKKGALPLDQALQHGIEIADALDKAHRQGVVHRDLKPGNIMLTKSGAKLLDFGLAKMTVAQTNAGGLSALPTEAKPLTQEGSILGTFQYMAPEQLEGKEADARTDIFAFGAVLYEMVTGKRAFEPGERKVLLQGGSFPNYVSTGQLVYNRTGTLMAVPFDLDRLGISGSPVPVIEGIRSPIAVLGGADFAISRTGTLADIAGSAEESASRLVWVDRQGVAEPSSAPPRNYEFPRVSPDGQRVAAGIREDETHIWVYDILRTTLTRQTFGGGLNTAPAWSLDGKWLAFISSREGPLNIFWQLAVGGGGVERLTTNDYRTAPASFSPDGQLLAFIEDNPEAGRAIRVLNLADREAETFLQTGYEETAPKFSRDGKWMVYTSTESGRREVYVQPYPGQGGKWQISSDGGGCPGRC